ncbi:unnamed protein product [Closterium sp. NIES-64]|nr:unnamed protein product [Closterium sp. NIES-64]
MSSAARPRCFLDIAFDGQFVGRIEVEVRPDVAPKTVENFVGLCNGTSSGLGYKGLTLHRIIPGFMAQGGNCGSSIFGQPFPDESFELRHTGRGVLSMANRGPNTNNCQFFICFTATPHLDGKHVTFTAEELDEATNNYARENSLGRGGFGTGYRGKLADGSPVLVMKLNPDNTRQAAEKFTREVTILTRADHPHLVKLLGYNPEARCIVYESLPAGSLEDRLLTEGGRKTMKQKHRLRIAAEASEALLFLHHLEPPILHQDVKPGNVMLNEDLSCKVGGVGLAKFLPANDSSIWGTVGYIDPLLLRTGKYGPQSDLYGLGLVILQLLTGEKVNKVLEFAKFGLDGILDHLDKTVQWNPEIVKEVADVALKCRDRMSRPDLETVVLPMLKKYAEQTKGEKEAEAAPPAAARGGGASKGHDKKGAAAAAAAAPQKKGLFGYLFGKR